MFRINTNARTVRMSQLNVEDKVAKNGEKYQVKSILFTVASDRGYYVQKVVDGKIKKEKQTDFVFCKAMGNIAQTLSDYACEKGTGGKVISRFLELSGHLETYTTKRTIPIERTVKIGDKNYKINFDTAINVEQTIFIVREMQFLDNNVTKVKHVSDDNQESISIKEICSPDQKEQKQQESKEQQKDIEKSNEKLETPDNDEGEVIGSIDDGIDSAFDINSGKAPF